VGRQSLPDATLTSCVRKVKTMRRSIERRKAQIAPKEG
jgi:hypothetical protein